MKPKLLIISYCLLILFASQGGATQQPQWLESVDFKQYQNRVVYLDFWASWCGPCRKSFPWLNQMHEKYKDRGLVIIGINLDRDKEKAQRFLTESQAQFLLYSDPTGKLAKEYQLQGMPSSFIFDGNGQLSEKHVGFKSSHIDEYEGNIVKLLNKLPELNE
jgi:thiol-disulfide isomerase/thioredoxin